MAGWGFYSMAELTQMNKVLYDYVKTGIEPVPDSYHGEGYRCSIRLKDDTYLPCVMLHRCGPAVALAMKRFEQEKKGKGIFGFGKNSYEEVVKIFVASGNRVNNYDIASVEASPFAIPLALLKQIEGETTMGWTGFVLEMRDGAMFAFGTSFYATFFDLPEGYSFDDVVAVHNHSYVSAQGELKRLETGMAEPPADYDLSKVYQERPHFICYYDA
jgi:hypothetical protein